MMLMTIALCLASSVSSFYKNDDFDDADSDHDNDPDNVLRNVSKHVAEDDLDGNSALLSIIRQFFW